MKEHDPRETKDRARTTNNASSPEAAPGVGPEASADPSSAAATAVLDDLETLRSRAQERDQFLALLQRTQADFDNYQKRNQREREQERRYAHRGLALDLLPVIDNLERALSAARQTGETASLLEGVSMTHAQLVDMLKRHGINRIEAQGQPFDPNQHQAVMQQPAAGVPPGNIVQVLEQGYTIHDRVLRPARVIVSVPPTG